MARYTLGRLYNDYHNTVIELSNIVINLSNIPQSLDRDVHIEGCFIRAVVNWENFVEEYFLRCMCSASTRNRTTLKPKTACSRDTRHAFGRLKINRERHEDYIDWLSNASLHQRVDAFFHHRSRLHKLCESPDRLYVVHTIRNAIAHRSISAITRFQNYVIDQRGYLASIDPSMAELLITPNRSNSKLIFIDIVDYYDGLADILTK